jgi:hypothetical protein
MAMWQSHGNTGCNRGVKRALLAGGLGLALMAAWGGNAARAQEDNETSIWNLDQRVFNHVLKGLGLKGPNDGEIEIRERSPLVVPPSRNLPPPETAAAPRSPAWPDDPDDKRRRQAAEKKKRASSVAAFEEAAGRQGDIITPSELNPSRTGTPSSSTTAAPGGYGAGTTDTGSAILPSQLGGGGSSLFSWQNLSFGIGGPKEEYGTFTQEPPRHALTAPPTGYQTPSPAQPYGVTKRTEYEKPVKTDELVVGR